MICSPSAATICSDYLCGRSLIATARWIRLACERQKWYAVIEASDSWRNGGFAAEVVSIEFQGLEKRVRRTSHTSYPKAVGFGPEEVSKRNDSASSRQTVLEMVVGNRVIAGMPCAPTIMTLLNTAAIHELSIGHAAEAFY